MFDLNIAHSPIGRSDAVELNPKGINHGFIVDNDGAGLMYTNIYPAPNDLTGIDRIKARDNILGIMKPVLSPTRFKLLSLYLCSMSD